ncbi:MAG: hydrolase [Sedimentisphaerales bacterium]|nr:hydrolase [Sedimentisphaerales bacterium]
MRHENLLSLENCVLLVVDIQEAFAPHIFEMDRVVQRSGIMIEAAQLLQIPIIVTEQYPRGLKRTVEPLREILGDCQYHEKLTFSCCQDPAICQALQSVNRTQVLLVGIEAHVCISQTAHDLLTMGLQPFIAADAVSSREKSDFEIALQRASQAGVILTTTEAAIMEMTFSSEHPAFRQLSKLIK